MNPPCAWVHLRIPPSLERMRIVQDAACNLAAAKLIGELVAERALAKGITAVVFDRGGYRYHGRVKQLAEAARAKGLQF